MAAALKKGDLKLRLNGVKLKGSWALIRTTGGDGRSWLLIKHRDEWAGPLDIAAFAPLSVKSGGDFTDIIEQEAPAIWTSNRAAKGAPGGLMKIVERAVAITEEEKKARRDARAQALSAERAPKPREGAAEGYNSRFDSTLHTAYARRQRSCRAISCAPEVGLDDLAALRHVAERQHRLVLGLVPREHRVRRTARVDDHDVHVAADRRRDLLHRVAGGEARHAAPFGQQVGNQDDRPAAPRQAPRRRRAPAAAASGWCRSCPAR